MKPFTVYVGYDSREPEASDVAISSLVRHSSIPVNVRELKERPLRHAGLYWRKWRAENGQKFDLSDGKPFSTEFSFSRFLVPALMMWEGWALFVDADWLFRADIAELLPELDNKYAVMVCQQHYQPKDGMKMDGQRQEAYHRKNWSSFMAFNCSHPSNKLLTPQVVNEEPGSWLHGFGWLENSEIGNLTHQWNWIDGTTSGEALGVHFTMGGPNFPHLRDADKPYFEEWRKEARRIGVWKDEEAA